MRICPMSWHKDAPRAAISPWSATTAASYSDSLAKNFLGSRDGVLEQAEHLSSHPCQHQPCRPERAGLAQPRLPFWQSVQYRESPGRVMGVSGDG